MQKAAIFVDAGYYYAQGSYAAFGETLKRHELLCNESAFLSDLGRLVRDQLPADGEVLRTYWYDGARGGAASPTQLEVGALSRVKLRLGRINGAGQQKGVDTLIVRDLMVLSQERSITHAFVLSGDEDLREGIAYAQDRGVVVGLLGIRGQRGTSQSSELAREADLIDEGATEAAKSSLTRAIHAEEVPDGTAVNFESVVDGFVNGWAASNSKEARASVITSRPSVPKEIDWQLLKLASQDAAGGRRLEEHEKREVRRHFWAKLALISHENSGL